MALLGELSVNVVARTDKLVKGLATAKSRLKGFGTDVKKLATSVGGLTGALVGGAGVFGLVHGFKQTVDELDKLAKTARKLGTDAGDLAGLRLAADRTGVSAQTLDMGLQRMRRRLGEIAITGKGEAVPALERLGITIEEIKGLKMDEQFQLIAQRMAEVTDQQEKLSVAQKLFDSEGVALVNTLALGADGLKAMRKEADALTGSLSSKKLEEVERAADAMARVRDAFKGVSNKIVIEIAPGIADFLEGVVALQQILRAPAKQSRFSQAKALYKKTPYGLLERAGSAARNAASNALIGPFSRALGQERGPIRPEERITDEEIKRLNQAQLRVQQDISASLRGQLQMVAP